MLPVSVPPAGSIERDPVLARDSHPELAADQPHVDRLRPDRADRDLVADRIDDADAAHAVERDPQAAVQRLDAVRRRREVDLVDDRPAPHCNHGAGGAGTGPVHGQPKRVAADDPRDRTAVDRDRCTADRAGGQVDRRQRPSGEACHVERAVPLDDVVAETRAAEVDRPGGLGIGTGLIEALHPSGDRRPERASGHRHLRRLARSRQLADHRRRDHLRRLSDPRRTPRCGLRGRRRRGSWRRCLGGNCRRGGRCVVVAPRERPHDRPDDHQEGDEHRDHDWETQPAEAVAQPIAGRCGRGGCDRRFSWRRSSCHRRGRSCRDRSRSRNPRSSRWSRRSRAGQTLRDGVGQAVGIGVEPAVADLDRVPTGQCMQVGRQLAHIGNLGVVDQHGNDPLPQLQRPADLEVDVVVRLGQPDHALLVTQRHPRRPDHHDDDRSAGQG